MIGFDPHTILSRKVPNVDWALHTKLGTLAKVPKLVGAVLCSGSGSIFWIVYAITEALYES